jgi:hypothetical protein
MREIIMHLPTLRARLATVVTGLVLVATGCQDTIVKALGPENGPEITVRPDYVRFYANDMDNVHDEMVATFSFSGTKATVIHRNFVHHGYATLAVVDAVGDTVYKSGLEWNLDLETREGVPGTWKAILSLYGARGRAEVTVQKPE